MYVIQCVCLVPSSSLVNFPKVIANGKANGYDAGLIGHCSVVVKQPLWSGGNSKWTIDWWELIFKVRVIYWQLWLSDEMRDIFEHLDCLSSMLPKVGAMWVGVSHYADWLCRILTQEIYVLHAVPILLKSLDQLKNYWSNTRPVYIHLLHLSCWIQIW